MSFVSFDTFAFTQKLKDGGFEDRQIKAQLEAITDALEQFQKVKIDDLATKHDLELLRLDLTAKIDRLEGLFKALEVSFKALEGSFKAHADRFDSKIDSVDTSIKAGIAADMAVLKWMFTFILGGLLGLALKVFL